MNIPSVLRGLAAALLLLGAHAAGANQVRLDVGLDQQSVLAGESRRLFVKVALTGLPLPERKGRAPINVALVLDRSGSMSGEKLDRAKQAAALALDYLGPEDIVSLVTYDDKVEVPVPATRLTDRNQVARAIEAISAGNSTALFAGVSKGAAEIGKFQGRHQVNRLVLLSDGLANVGPSSPAELARLGRQLGGQGMAVTTIGLGLGYNEDLMVRLAAASDGNHVFAEQPSELAGVFRNEFGELGTVVAQQVTVTIDCRDGVRPLRVLGREAEIAGQRVTARLNQLYAEQEKYLLLEVEAPVGRDGEERELVAAQVNYDDLASRRNEQLTQAARLRYTASAEAAQRSVVPQVAISVSEQKGAELDEKAIELKDKGETHAAREMMRRKGDLLEQDAKRYDSEKLRTQSEKARKAEAAVAAPPAEWSKARKEMREEQNAVINQQKVR